MAKDETATERKPRATDKLDADQCAALMGWTGVGRAGNWTKRMGTASGRPEHDGMRAGDGGHMVRYWIRRNVVDFINSIEPGKPGRKPGKQCTVPVPHAADEDRMRPCRRNLPCPQHSAKTKTSKTVRKRAGSANAR